MLTTSYCSKLESPVALLAIDGEDAIGLNQLEQELQQLSGITMTCQSCADLSHGIDLLANNSIDLVLWVIAEQGEEEQIGLSRLVSLYPGIDVIVIGSNENTEFAFDCIERGARDYLTEEAINAFLLHKIIYFRQQRKKMVEQLTEEKENAEAANQLKTRFLANISHEIRTPLNAIIGFSEIIKFDLEKKNLDPEVTAPQVESIYNSGKHLLNIISDLIDISRIEENALVIENTFFPLDRLWKDIEQFVSEKELLETNIEIIPSTHCPDTYYGDFQKIRQILVHVVSNAVKFSLGKKVYMEASFSQNKKDHLHIQIIDQGIGMTEAQIQQAFLPFSQADVSTTREYGGTGIGLAIVQRLIEVLGASLDIDSKPKKGTTVHIQLPINPNIVIPDMSEKSPKSESNDSIISSEEKILIVENDIPSQQTLQTQLNYLGITSTITSSGQEALDYLAEHSCDLILLDIQMPSMDGIATAQLVQEMFRKGSIAKLPSIIAVTADATKSIEIDCIDAGFDLFITKPVNLKKLRKALECIQPKLKNGEAVPFQVF